MPGMVLGRTRLTVTFRRGDRRDGESMSDRSAFGAHLAMALSSEPATGAVAALRERADELTDHLEKVTADAPRQSDPAWAPLPTSGHDTAVTAVRSVVAATADPTEFDPESVIQLGADQARQRLTVSAVIEADRIGFRGLWHVMAAELTSNPDVDAHTLHQMTTNLHTVEERFATEKFAGYRDQWRRQVIEETSQHSMQIDSLLHGHHHDAWTLWEIANYLGLPAEGPFIVIAAEVPSLGCHALPQIQSKLRSLDVFSAWRLMPDLEVGIAHIASEHQLDRVIALLTRMAVDRIGVSACFDDLRETPLGLHFAKVSLRGKPAAKVAVFDGSMLATAAVSAPAAMVKSATAALAGFADLPDDEREILFETLRAWLDTNSSVRACADVLIVHPNTVRKRLRRIEQRTGRSLSRLRDVAELSLALEVHRRLM